MFIMANFVDRSRPELLDLKMTTVNCAGIDVSNSDVEDEIYMDLNVESRKRNGQPEETVGNSGMQNPVDGNSLPGLVMVNDANFGHVEVGEYGTAGETSHEYDDVAPYIDPEKDNSAHVEEGQYVECGGADVNEESIYESFDDLYVVANDVAEQLRKSEEQRLASKRKKENKRKHVIEEVVHTEKEYVKQLDLIIEKIMDPLAKVEFLADIKVEAIFGNIKEVRQISSKFLSALQAAVDCPSVADAHVAKVFNEHKSEMEIVYEAYCKNYDDSIALLKKYSAISQFQQCLTQCIIDIRDEYSAIDLTSLLIKPVQRVTKYSLLFKDLLRATDTPSHDDPYDVKVHYQELLLANVAAENVTTAANEATRRKELVKKYQPNGSDSKKTSSFAHGLIKKTNRLSARLKVFNKLEMVDEAFNAALDLHQRLNKGIGSLIQNIRGYLQAYAQSLKEQKVAIESADDVIQSDYCTTVTPFMTAMSKVVNFLLDQFKDNINQRVLSPLTTLQQRLREPQHLITKREHKLLDYESCLNKKDTKENTQLAKNTYEALNRQLTEDLEKLCQFSQELIHSCLAAYVKQQIDFENKVLQTMLPVLEQYKGRNVSLVELEKSAIENQFTEAHDQVLLGMRAYTIIPSEFTDKPSLDHAYAYNVNTRKVPALQSPLQRQSVQQNYDQNNLFLAISDYSSTDSNDLTCTTKELIGVIKRGDPAGNKRRWYCDNGVAKGFLPSNVLSPTSASPVPSRLRAFSTPHESQYVPDSTQAMGRTQSLKSRPAPSPYSFREGLYSSVDDGESPYDEIGDLGAVVDTVIDEEDEMLDDTEYPAVGARVKKDYYKVSFDFNANSKLELSVKKDEIVCLLVPHDRDGSPQWCLVANSKGKQGYVPHNYIIKATNLQFYCR